MIKIKAPTELDTEKIGLKVGLEFHQQIHAPYPGTKDPLAQKHGSKLFCPCPSFIREDDADIIVYRQLRAVSGETGEVDIAAKFEQMKRSMIKYEAYSDTTCLVELDEEPIFPINKDALFKALAISKHVFNLTLVKEIQVLRKTIVDGSNTSGFQRTAEIAYRNNDSYIIVDGKKIGILQTSLEEDSAKNMGREGGKRVFRLDRLGIPLIEIATAPDMHTPEMARKVAERIGLLLRLTGYVKRGLGTIRQDLNVSIAKGTRIEIKGVQQLDLIEKYVKNEAIRQQRMLELLEYVKNELKFNENDIEKIVPIDLKQVFKKTNAKLIQKTLKAKGTVTGALIPKFNGLLKYELQPNYRVGTEFSEIAKVVAGAGGILHSDELPKYGITEEEVSKVREKLGISKNDGFILLVGDKKQGTIAVNGIKEMLKLWLQGLPREVRAPRPDGTTGYLRPLPGGSRMYPETDSPPILLDQELLEKINKVKFDTPEERLQRYMTKYKLSNKLANQMLKHPQASFFEELVEEYNVDAKLAATTIVETLVSLRREGVDVDLINENILKTLLQSVSKGEIPRDAISDVIITYSKQKGKRTLEKIIEELKASQMSDEELKQIIREIVKENEQMIKEKGMRSMGALMGKIMSKVQGKADGRKVSSILKEELSNAIN